MFELYVHHMVQLTDKHLKHDIKAVELPNDMYVSPILYSFNISFVSSQVLV